MSNYHYVYILVSERNPKRHYTGLTDDPVERIRAHNAGQVPHTSRFRPWRFESAIVFRSQMRASAFEKYLKSHSGRVFAKKHL